MFYYLWPMILVIITNALYQVCTKSVPKDMNPFASLTITYFIGTLASIALFFATNKDGSLIREFGKTNWVPFVLGLVILGLGAGWIYAYKAGWQVGTSFIIQSAVLTAILICIGYIFYHEPLSWYKLAGIGICLIGLIVISR